MPEQRIHEPKTKEMPPFVATGTTFPSFYSIPLRSAVYVTFFDILHRLPAEMEKRLPRVLTAAARSIGVFETADAIIPRLGSAGFRCYSRSGKDLIFEKEFFFLGPVSPSSKTHTTLALMKGDSIRIEKYDSWIGVRFFFLLFRRALTHICQIPVVPTVAEQKLCVRWRYSATFHKADK